MLASTLYPDKAQLHCIWKAFWKKIPVAPAMVERWMHFSAVYHMLFETSAALISARTLASWSDPSTLFPWSDPLILSEGIGSWDIAVPHWLCVLGQLPPMQGTKAWAVLGRDGSGVGWPMFS